MRGKHYVWVWVMLIGDEVIGASNALYVGEQYERWAATVRFVLCLMSQRWKIPLAVSVFTVLLSAAVRP